MSTYEPSSCENAVRPFAFTRAPAIGLLPSITLPRIVEPGPFTTYLRSSGDCALALLWVAGTLRLPASAGDMSTANLLEV